MRLSGWPEPEKWRLPMQVSSKLNCHDYLLALGVADLPRLTSPFDPGYDPVTLSGHLGQSSQLISILKISMACWLVANEGSTRYKVSVANTHRVPTVTGGGPFEIAVAQGRLPEYLDLCADIGFTRIECGQGFTDMRLTPDEVMRMAKARGLEVQYELGKKHTGAFNSTTAKELINEGDRWLQAGARELVVEARESAQGVGLFDDQGKFSSKLADLFAEAFGLEPITFEAPTKASQFALLNHFGPTVRLCNIRLEELLRVEIYRRGLHSDAFCQANLRPQMPAETARQAL